MLTSLLLATVVPAICSLVALWLILRFFWRVYRHGGPADMHAAAQALRLVRPPIGAPRARRRLARRAALSLHEGNSLAPDAESSPSGPR
jgi:hypothetical protein